LFKGVIRRLDDLWYIIYDSNIETQTESAKAIAAFLCIDAYTVGVEENLERAGLKVTLDNGPMVNLMIEEKKITIETQTISDVVPPILRSRMKENRHGPLIIDLLRLPQLFSYRRYRLDIIGFLIGWLWVVLLVGLGYWITKIGAS
jgi:hypothetical protein